MISLRIIGKNCIIGAGTLIPQDKVIPDNCVVFGNPGKIQREISEEEMFLNDMHLPFPYIFFDFH